MLPIVIPEELVSLFQYWQEDVKAGMMYQNELYQKIRVYALNSCLVAYEDSYQLAARDNKLLCITVSSSGYTLWQCLRTRITREARSMPEESPLPEQEFAKCA
jgi:hypothetical protein